MDRGFLNIVTDGQWGSCGKALITTALAHKHRPDIISTTNMANAGHTAVNEDGEAFIAKALPSAAILNKWIPDYNPKIVVGSSAAFTLDQMMKEIEITGNPEVIIHPRAGVITDIHRQIEEDIKGGTKHLASTMQGCGAFLSDKVMRKKDLKLARDYDELKDYVYDGYLHDWLYDQVKRRQTILHEGAQGFSLDINHGSHYPECTSRGTTATQNLADLGLPSSMLRRVFVVIRPYPIRVGNVKENNETVGYSGGCYDDQHEITWQQVMHNSNAPDDVAKNILNKELTTVTKRLRRVFSFSDKQLKYAVRVNGATDIALNFANYIDWSCYGCNKYEMLSDKVIDFIHRVEDTAGVPVSIVGTGPQNNHVCFL